MSAQYKPGKVFSTGSADEQAPIRYSHLRMVAVIIGILSPLVLVLWSVHSEGRANTTKNEEQDAKISGMAKTADETRVREQTFQNEVLQRLTRIETKVEGQR